MALAQGKPVLILDLEDKSQGAKANNAQIREIMQVHDSGVRRARLAHVLHELNIDSTQFIKKQKGSFFNGHLLLSCRAVCWRMAIFGGPRCLANKEKLVWVIKFHDFWTLPRRSASVAAGFPAVTTADQREQSICEGVWRAAAMQLAPTIS